VIESEEQAKQHVLVIDDSKVVRWQAKKVLEKDYQVHLAEDGRQAWELLQENEHISLAFCDLQMPEMNGYQLLEKIRSSNDVRLINLPVLIITGDADNQEVKHRCLESGATDFIPKPFDEVILKGRAAAYTGYHSRISKLESQVEHDHLTGLASLQYFRKFGEQGLAMALRYHTEVTVVLVQLDRQEAILERLGKRAFAQVLVRIGKQITAQLREEDLVARLALSRYGVILPLTNRVGAKHAVERIHQSVNNLHLKFAGEPLKLTFSLGVTSLDLEQKVDFKTLLKQTKRAMKQAQAEGGDSVIVFEEADVASPPDVVIPITETVQQPVMDAENAAISVADTAEAEPLSTDATVDTSARIDDVPVKEEVLVPTAEPEEEIPALHELNSLLQRMDDEGLGQPLLRDLMRRLMPLLQYADKRLDLGLSEALTQAIQRLDKN